MQPSTTAREKKGEQVTTALSSRGSRIEKVVRGQTWERGGTCPGGQGFLDARKANQLFIFLLFRKRGRRPQPPAAGSEAFPTYEEAFATPERGRNMAGKRKNERKPVTTVRRLPAAERRAPRACQTGVLLYASSSKCLRDRTTLQQLWYIMIRYTQVTSSR